MAVHLVADRLVSGTLVVSFAVGEEPVDDDATNREQEHQQRPEDLVEDRAV